MQNVYSVAQVNSYIKNMFTQDYLLQSISVKGEISNCKYHSSGHIYFTLKDKLSVIACVMFAGNRAGLSFTIKEGMQVVVTGNVDTYERDGKYQLYAKKIRQDGLGALYEEFERRKRELSERGLFAPEYKQPLPQFTKVLGVVTAPTGAAIQDIISISKNRNPYIQIVLYPAIVQGENAVPSIVKGIKALEKYGVDVMIVGRGGGSIEDLWAFNEEEVAQAIFDCSIPIISAVGHETDTTIADFTADFRAETPSAAAQMAVNEISLLDQNLLQYRQTIERNMKNVILQKQMALQNRLMLLKRLSPQAKIREKRFETIQWEERLREGMQGVLQNKKKMLAINIERMRGVSPLDKLKQGFTFMEDSHGHNVSEINMVMPGDAITAYVKNGKILATVTGKEDVAWEKKKN